MRVGTWDDLDFGNSLNFSLSKLSGYEGMSLTDAALDDILQRGDRVLPITTERIACGEKLLGTYEVLSEAIPGGMGSVWRVRHMDWDTELAMKRPHPQLFAEASDETKRGFIEECEHWIDLGLHAHIVSCYYVREIGGVPTVFAEWMDGGSLEDAIAKGALYEGADDEKAERLLDIAIQTARGLAYSHAQGLLHQDVKPGNVLLSSAFDAKVSDFGLAKAASAVAGEEALLTSGRTLAYAPPEQTNGATAEAWMDVFAWALTVLETYVGRCAWKTGAEAADRLANLLADTKVPVPADLRTLLTRCTTEHVDGFASVLPELERIYRATVGFPYPRPVSDTVSDTIDALNNRALSMLDLGRREAAQFLWAEALKRDPDDTRSIVNSGLAELRALGEERRDSYDDKVVDALGELSSRAFSSSELRPTYEKKLLSARLFLARYDHWGANREMQIALERCPQDSSERPMLERQAAQIRHSWLELTRDPDHLAIKPAFTGALSFDYEGGEDGRVAVAWVARPEDGGDTSWTQLAVFDLADQAHPHVRKLTELSWDGPRDEDAPTFIHLFRVLWMNGAITLIDTSSDYVSYDPDTLELIDSGDIDDLPFEIPYRDDWPMMELGDGLREVRRPSVVGPMLDIETMWDPNSEAASAMKRPLFSIGPIKEDHLAEKTGLHATYPAQGLRSRDHVVCADHTGRFLLLYDDAGFDPAGPRFIIVDTKLFGVLPEYAVAHVMSYRGAFDAERAQQRALETAREALEAHDLETALAALDEAYELFPEEPGEEWTELNEKVGRFCVRSELRGVRTNIHDRCREMNWDPYLREEKTLILMNRGSMPYSYRCFGAGEARYGELAWAEAQRLPFESEQDVSQLGKYYHHPKNGDIISLPKAGYNPVAGAAYDRGTLAVYTCAEGRFTAWVGGRKLWSVCIGAETSGQSGPLPEFDPSDTDTRWALEPYRIFLNRERDATVALVRSRLLNPFREQRQDGTMSRVTDLHMLTLVDLRTYTVLHSEAFQPDRRVRYGESQEIAALTLLGMSADGSLLLINRNAGIGWTPEIDLWDMEEPGAFSVYQIHDPGPGARPHQLGLRGDGNAFLTYDQEDEGQKMDEPRYQNFQEYLLDWKYRLPADAAWKEQEQAWWDEACSAWSRGPRGEGVRARKQRGEWERAERLRAREVKEAQERRHREIEERERLCKQHRDQIATLNRELSELRKQAFFLRSDIAPEMPRRQRSNIRDGRIPSEYEKAIEALHKELEEARATLGSLGFFQMGRKRELRERIAELEADIAQRQEELDAKWAELHLLDARIGVLLAEKALEEARLSNARLDSFTRRNHPEKVIDLGPLEAELAEERAALDQL